MPPLIRLYIVQTLVGFGLSAVFVATLMWFNVANLWHLVTHTDVGVLALALLWVFNGIVFAGAQFGISIMRMAGDDDGPSHGRNIRIGEPIPVRVEASSPKRHL